MRSPFTKSLPPGPTLGACGCPPAEERTLITKLFAATITAVLSFALAAPSAPQKLTFDMSEMKIAATAPTLKAGVPAEITILNSGKAEHELQTYLTPKAAPKNWDT